MLTERGLRVQMIATHDPFVSSQVVENTADGASIVRIPYFSSRDRINFFLGTPKPKLTVWQFSSFYSLHPRGFPIGLDEWMAAALGHTQTYFICHELWITPRHKLDWGRMAIGRWQKDALVRMIKKWSPRVVVHLGYYAERLRREGIESVIFPVFGGIPMSNLAKGWFRDEMEARGIPKGNLLVGVFGTVHPDWNPAPQLDQLRRFAAATGRQITIIFAGRGGSHLERMIGLLNGRETWLTTEVLGEQSPERISDFLLTVDFGLSTNPWKHNGKSSTVAAMLEHGVPVLGGIQDHQIAPTDDPGRVILSAEVDLTQMVRGEPSSFATQIAEDMSHQFDVTGQARS